VAPRPLNRLLAKALVTVDGLVDELANGQSASDWRAAMERVLARYHTAALLTGQGNTALTPQGRQTLAQTLVTQLRFLNRFAIEIQDAAEFMTGWRARAAMYALGIQQDYWSGATRFLPLPAMPCDGSSQCLTRCKCHWQIDWIDEENGDADCYWVMGATEYHCQTCPQRAADWAPLKVRGGKLL
jgi:hypothetical protein